MSPYIATLILIWGLFDLSSVEPVTASRRHIQHHRRFTHYDLAESVPRQLSLRRFPAEPDRRSSFLEPRLQDDGTGNSRRRPKRFNNHWDGRASFQREVSQNNDSLCEYTVTPMKPIFAKNGTIIVGNLKEITCKELGNPCHTGVSHCCIQKFTIINGTYFFNGKSVTYQRQVNTSCVCAHNSIKNATPELRLNQIV